MATLRSASRVSLWGGLALLLVACAATHSPSPRTFQPSAQAPKTGPPNDRLQADVPADFPVPDSAHLSLKSVAGTGSGGSVAAVWEASKPIADTVAFYANGTFTPWTLDLTSSDATSATFALRDGDARFPGGLLVVRALEGRRSSLALYLGPIAETEVESAAGNRTREVPETVLPSTLPAALVPPNARVVDAAEVSGTGRVVAWLDVPLDHPAAVDFYRDAFAELHGAAPTVMESDGATLLSVPDAGITFAILIGADPVAVRIVIDK